MKVLMISGDTKALTEGSAVHRRLCLQAKETDGLTVFVRAPREGETSLSGSGVARGFSGGKLRAARAMMRRARLEEFTIVTAQDPFLLGLIAWRIARQGGAALQLQLHTDVLSPAYAGASTGNALRALLARFLLRRADCIRVVAPRMKEVLERSGVCAPMSVLPIFIDENAIREAPPADFSGHLQYKKKVLIVARLEREKRLMPLLSAVKDIAAASPDTGFFIAGDGSQRAALEHTISEWGIQERVVFLGHRSDVYSLYKSVDLMLAATAPYEGYGAATVEALAAGCPVVSLDVGVAREAGAHVVLPGFISRAALQALSSGEKGKLALRLPSAAEWSAVWREGMEMCAHKI